MLFVGVLACGGPKPAAPDVAPVDAVAAAPDAAPAPDTASAPDTAPAPDTASAPDTAPDVAALDTAAVAEVVAPVMADNGLPADLVARLEQGKPGCIGISKSGKSLLILEDYHEVLMLSEVDVTNGEASDIPLTPPPLSDPELVKRLRSKGYVLCNAAAVGGDGTINIPKLVPIVVRAADTHRVEVGIAGNLPVSLTLQGELGFSLEHAYWNEAVGPVVVVYEQSNGGDSDEDDYAFVAPTALGEPACARRLTMAVPVTPAAPPAFEPVKAGKSCVAMTADGMSAAIDTYYKNRMPEGGGAAPPTGINWYGPGPAPAIDLSCMQRGCSAEQKAALIAEATKLGLVGCSETRGKIALEGREVPFMYKDLALQLKTASGWRVVHRMRSGNDGDGHEELWKLFQHPAGGPVYALVGNQDTDREESLVYTLTTEGFNLCAKPAADLLAVNEVKASSSAKDGGGYKFGAGNLIDDDLSTSWQPASWSAAEPATLELVLPAEAEVHALRIGNGFQRKDGNGDMFTMNARAAELTVTFSDGTSEKLTLASRVGLIEVPLAAPKRTTSVKITINAIHPGSRWANDVALSEVQLVGPR